MLVPRFYEDLNVLHDNASEDILHSSISSYE